MMKKLSFILSLVLLSALCLFGCGLLENGIRHYAKDKEECLLSTDNVTQFTYKGEHYTLLENTLSDKDLGAWVGYIRKLAVIDSSGKILEQQSITKEPFQSLAKMADSIPNASHVIPFLNVYTVKDGPGQELIVEADGGYHEAIPSSMVKAEDNIFHYDRDAEAYDTDFSVNPRDCTQLLCGKRVYQITDKTVPKENIGEYLDIIADSFTFDCDTHQIISRKNLLVPDWSGNEQSCQKRQQWTLGGIYGICQADRSVSVAVEINSEYRLATALP